jgi:hypothetical protein
VESQIRLDFESPSLYHSLTRIFVRSSHLTSPHLTSLSITHTHARTHARTHVHTISLSFSLFGSTPRPPSFAHTRACRAHTCVNALSGKHQQQQQQQQQYCLFFREGEGKEGRVAHSRACCARANVVAPAGLWPHGRRRPSLLSLSLSLSLSCSRSVGRSIACLLACSLARSLARSRPARGRKYYNGEVAAAAVNVVPSSRVHACMLASRARVSVREPRRRAPFRHLARNEAAGLALCPSVPLSSAPLGSHGSSGAPPNTPVTSSRFIIHFATCSSPPRRLLVASSSPPRHLSTTSSPPCRLKQCIATTAHRHPSRRRSLTAAANLKATGSPRESE